MKDLTGVVLMEFFLKETGKLGKKRMEAGFDPKQEMSTYNAGYLDALMDISKAMIKKTNLE